MKGPTSFSSEPAEECGLQLPPSHSEVHQQQQLTATLGGTQEPVGGAQSLRLPHAGPSVGGLF